MIVPGDLSKEEDVKALFARALETFGAYFNDLVLRYVRAQLNFVASSGRVDLLFNVSFPFRTSRPGAQITVYINLRAIPNTTNLRTQA